MELNMTPDRLDISRLKDAVIIRYYIAPDGELGLIVIDSENRVINLTESDPCFTALENAAARAFIDAPDSPADSFTSEILEKRTAPASHNGLNTIFTDEPLMMSAVPESKKVTVHRKLLSYCLEMLCTRLGTSFDSLSDIEGYRKRYSASITVGGAHRSIPFTFKEDSRQTEYRFGSILPTAPHTSVTVRYFFDSADILITCGTLTISDCYSFSDASHRLMIVHDSDLIFDDTLILDVQKGSIPDGFRGICLFGDKTDKIVTLPWCTLYSVQNDSELVHILVENDDDMSFAVVHENMRSMMTGEDIITDSLCAVHEADMRGEDMLISTLFIPSDTFSKQIRGIDTGKWYIRKAVNNGTEEE